MVYRKSENFKQVLVLQKFKEREKWLFSLSLNLFPERCKIADK